MADKPQLTKWTIITVIILFLGAIGTIASLSDRIVLQREYIPHIAEFTTHRKDNKETNSYIIRQLDDIKKLIINNRK